MNGVLWLETSCEHGEMEQHPIAPVFLHGARWTCLGGSRRRVTVDYEAAALDFAGLEEWGDTPLAFVKQWRVQARAGVDAALQVEEE